MSDQTNFQKIREFHETSNLDNHFEHQYDALNNEKLVNLRLGLIQEEFNELKEAIEQRDFPEVRDAIADILYVVYGTAASFGIDADGDYDKVHKSNMTKFCKTEDLAQRTVEDYQHRFDEGSSPYDSPAYRRSINGKYYIVYNKSTGKILKSLEYQPVDLSV
jgi:predicted HAD superfamily Cof-like phosphohydrolase